MRNDATEAALGLLGLTGSLPFSTTPTIPLKRKTSTATTNTTTTTSLSHPPHAHNDIEVSAATDSSESIHCICGFTYDDGFSIACDDCSRWVHAACFDIVEGGVPEEWRCWVCEPRRVDREKAVRLQRTRQRQLQELEAERSMSRRRVNSPGVDRKRRASAAAIDGGSTAGAGAGAKRKRRSSVNNQHTAQHSHQHQQQQPTHGAEDEHIDIDEPAAAAHTYVHIDKDLVPHQHTNDKLKRLAQHWRGVTALDSPTDSASSPVLLTPDAFHDPPPTVLHPLPPNAYSHPTLSSNTNPYVRPQSYVVHTTQPIPTAGLIAPYTSTIIPSTVYLSDPLNSYAHLGMPKPFVHLIGPPLDVALDARLAGNGTRFVRSGCRPNAVLRPVLCHTRDGDPRESTEDSLAFGVFAMRDLKANEEVVLGWEWDDGSVIHHLPALINTPHLFAPSHFEHFRHQMTSMLHAITSTFTTCACGAAAKDCALARLAEFVDGAIPPTPSPSPPSQYPDDGSYAKNGQLIREGGVDKERRSRSSTADLGPLVGVERGFRTRERVPFSGGMSGVEMVTNGTNRYPGWEEIQSPEAGPSKLPTRLEYPAREPKKGFDRKGKGRATENVGEAAVVGNRRSRRKTSSSQSQSPISKRSRSPIYTESLIPAQEEQLPPKLRKKWIRRNSDALKEASSHRSSPRTPASEWPAPVRPPEIAIPEDRMEVDTPIDDTASMPPPSLSPSPSLQGLLPPPVTSPTSDFANLSLLSPLVNGPAPHFPGSFHRARPGSSLSSGPSPSPVPSLSPAPSTASAPAPSPVFAATPLSPSIPSSTVTPPDDTSILGSPFARRDPVQPEVLQRAAQDASPVENSHTLFVRESTPNAIAIQPPDIASIVSADPNPEHGTVPPLDGTSSETAMEDVVPYIAPTRSGPPSDNAASSPMAEAAVVPTTDAADSMDVSMPPAGPCPSAPNADEPMHAAEGDATETGHATEADVTEAATVDQAANPPAIKEMSPLPPPKVKLSLKDFALRKKKQREEEQVKAQASPIVSSGPLPEQHTDVKQSSPDPVVDQHHSGSTEGVEAVVEESVSTEEEPPPVSAQPEEQILTPTVNRDARSEPLEVAREHSEAVDADTHVGKPAPSEISLQTKVELVEASLPTDLPVIRDTPPALPSTRPSSPMSRSPPSYPCNKKETELSTRQTHSSMFQLSQHALARQISQEDGEIFSPPAPKPLPLAPRAHSPPTHPRGFHSFEGASPSRPAHGPPRRPPPPAPYRSQSQNITINSRPLPSGPRALRGANGSSHYTPSPSTSRPLGGSHLPPRAPSADRDRDRMDWDRDRGRMGSWSRSRGGGGWR